jgi:hypothetical protein
LLKLKDRLASVLDEICDGRLIWLIDSPMLTLRT